MEAIVDPWVCERARLTVRREMGGSAVAGTRFSAVLDGELVGFVDLLTDLTNGGTLSRLAGWGEIDSLGWRRRTGARASRPG